MWVPIKEGAKPLEGGRIRLLADENAFRQSFARFEDDDENGFSLEKLERMGQKATADYVDDSDRTITAKFDDEETLDFPFESVLARAIPYATATNEVGGGVWSCRSQT